MAIKPKINKFLDFIGSGGPDFIDNVINVGVGLPTIEGKQYSSIKAALDSIVAPSSTNRHVIEVGSGVYQELPMTGKQYTTLKSIGSNIDVRIEAIDINTPLITADQRFVIEGFTLLGVTNSCTIEMNVAGPLILRDIAISDCLEGVCVNNIGASVTMYNLTAASFIGTISDLIKIDSGNVNLQGCTIAGQSNINNIISVSGINSIATLNNIISFSTNVQIGYNIHDQARVVSNTSSMVGMVDGIVIDGGARFELKTVTIFNAQNDGIRINDIGSDTQVDLAGTTIEDSVSLDFNCVSASALITGAGKLSIEKSFVAAGTRVFVSILDLFEGDEGINILGELHVGRANRATESALGGGDSYTNGMLVYTYDGADYVDISTEAASSSGSTFQFPNVNVNTAIYVSTSLLDTTGVLDHFGLKILLDTSGNLGAGNIVMEFWNGSIWEEFNYMVTEGSQPYFPHAKSIFDLVSGNYQLRYDNQLARNGWNKNDAPGLGTDYYWIRFRIDTAITTSPIFEQFKLHSNRFEVNGDGWIEFFGSSRPISQLPVSIGNARPFEGNMQTQSIWIDEDIGVGLIQNKFTATGDKTGFNLELPFSADTSTKVKFTWAGRSDAGQTIGWTIRWAHVTEGDGLYTSDPGLVTPTAKSLTLINEIIAGGVLEVFEAELDISDMISRRDGGVGDELWISIQPSTLASNFSLVSASANYTRWSSGGHI